MRMVGGSAAKTSNLYGTMSYGDGTGGEDCCCLKSDLKIHKSYVLPAAPSTVTLDSLF